MSENVPTPRTDEIALRLTGVTGLWCDDQSLDQYNDLLRLSRQLERELAAARNQALEEAEKVCMNSVLKVGRGYKQLIPRGPEGTFYDARAACAAAIRALKSDA